MTLLRDADQEHNDKQQEWHVKRHEITSTKQKALGGTPAMAAGLTDRVWSVEDIIGLLDVAEKKAA